MGDERRERYRLEAGLLEVRQALEKAWHLSNLAEEYFDLRDETALSAAETEAVLLGYGGAALEHEMVHDYVTQALGRVKELERWAVSDRGGSGGIG